MKTTQHLLLFPVFLCLSILLSAGTTAAEEKDSDPAMDFFKGDPDYPYPTPGPLLVNAMARDYRSLNGPWNIVLDEAGMSYNYITNGLYFEHESTYPETGMNLLEISFDKRKQLMVPGDWNSQRPELDRYRSRVLYHKNVEMNPVRGQRYLLHFGGANYTADLFVNKQLVGRHVGGYTAFNFDITEYVRKGNNTFIVRVNALLDETTIPTMRTSDFWKYGGLTRDVGLVTLPETYIGQYHLYITDHSEPVIHGWVQLAGEQSGKREIEVNIPDAGLTVKATTDASGRAVFSAAPETLELWSPDNPRLYEVTLSMGDEHVQDRIGFRTVKTDGVKVLLNGEPMRFRGISMHEETVRHPGLANSREDALAQFKLVKELNANFVRLAHYPHNEHTVRLADELGLMLWSEVPIVSLIDWNNTDTLATAISQVSENVMRDANRAAIVMWSIANESFPQTDARLEFLSTLAETVRRLDASGRPIVSALIGAHEEEFREIGKQLMPAILAHPELPPAARERIVAMTQRGQPIGAAEAAPAKPPAQEIPVVISDPLGEIVDIVGYNEYFGWYYSRPMAEAMGLDEGIVRDAMISIMPRIRFSNSFGKPMIISEFGAGAVRGLRSDEGLIWSEDYQARVYRAQLQMLDQSPVVQGYSPWVLQDFRSHLRELNGIQDTYNRKGLVSETGEKKLAFKLLADHYRKLAAE